MEEVQLRKRNEVLRNAILAQYRSVHSFCNKRAFNPTKVGELINLKRSPCTEGGRWRVVAQNIADELRMLPEDLFPQELYTQFGDWDSERIEFLSLDEITGVSDSGTPLDVLLRDEKVRVVRIVLETLTLREQNVLRVIFYEALTSQRMQELFGISRQGVDRIRKKALRKLKQPTRIKRLREVA